MISMICLISLAGIAALSHAQLPDFRSDHYVEDHVTQSTHVDFVYGLRYRDEDKPDHCRHDLCLSETTYDSRKGDFTWPKTVVSYRQHVRCPYAVDARIYGYRDCRLTEKENGTLVPEWREAHIDQCPGTPLTETLKEAKSVLNETTTLSDSTTKQQFLRILETIKLYYDQPLFEDNIVDLFHGLHTSLERAVGSGQAMTSPTLDVTFKLIDWLIKSHEEYFASSILYGPRRSRIIWMLTVVTEMHAGPASGTNLRIEGDFAAITVKTVSGQILKDVTFASGDRNNTMATTATVRVPWTGQKVVRFLYLPLPNYFYGADGVEPHPEYLSLVTAVLYVSVSMDTEWSSSRWLENSGTTQDIDVTFNMLYDSDKHVTNTRCGQNRLELSPTDSGLNLETWSASSCNLITSGDASTKCSCGGSGFYGIFSPALDYLLRSFDDYMYDTDIMRTQHTSMAVFLGFPYRFELYITSHVFRAVSLVCLLLTVISYSIYRKSRRGTPTKILLNLCVSLIALLVALYISEAISYSKLGCRVSNVLRYYLVLVTLLWNGIEAVNMYLMLVKVFNHHVRHFVLKSAAVAWGAPLVPIIIVFIADVKGFDGIYTDDCDFRCRLKKPVLYYGYLLPLAVILIHNIVVFALVIKVLRKSGSKLAASKGRDPGILMRLCGAVSMMVLLGIPWIFSAFGAIDAVETTSALKTMEAVFHVVFVVCVNLQGVFIFCFHCARNAEMRQHWKTTLSRTQSTSVSSGRRSSADTEKHRRKSSYTDSSVAKNNQQTEANDALLANKKGTAV